MGHSRFTVLCGVCGIGSDVSLQQSSGTVNNLMQYC